MMLRHPLRAGLSAGAACALMMVAAGSHAASHREAPFIAGMPRVDATDLYLFRSYESGRADYVTLIANYQPLQGPYGGPNYFPLDDSARYAIHIDNDGDAVEDITFRFDFETVLADLTVPTGDEMADVSVPLKNIGVIGPGAGDVAAVNSRQTYTVQVVRGDRRTGDVQAVTDVTTGSATFMKPVDNIGEKSIPDYAAYAQDHIHTVAIPGCNAQGRMFVGQRREGFAVNLGEIFDLVNTNPLGPVDAETSVIADTNITSLALEVPIACLTTAGEPVIGAWTTASLPQARVLNPSPAAPTGGKPAAVSGGAFTQVSRLGMPLVNEVIIGLKDKDRFNASEPKDDGQFLTYVTNPTLPELLEILFGGAGAAAPETPRDDLVTAFLTGVPDLNQPANVTASEMLRLNTETPVTAVGSQSNLGVLGGDSAGFPNGRRPGDDVVDITLRVAMGALVPGAPNENAPFTDGATVSAADFQAAFPYLNTPLPGSPSN